MPINDEFRIGLHKLVEEAIEFEKTCQCAEHLEGRRLSEYELNCVRIIFGTHEGFSMLMGIVDEICVRSKDFKKNHFDNIKRLESEL